MIRKRVPWVLLLLMIVDGKYVIDSHQVGSAEQVPAVLSALNVTARSEQKAKKQYLPLVEQMHL